MPYPQTAHTATGQDVASGVDAARALVYDLVIDAQTADCDVLDAARALARQASEAGWHDVRAIADYAVATANWWSEPRVLATQQHLAAFSTWARRSGDPLALALSSCARAGAALIDEDARSGAIDDLVHAYAAAERIETTVDRAFALHEIAGEFQDQRLWELTSEIYAEVERLSTGLHGPRALVGSLAVNRFYTVACELLHAREAGDMAQVHDRAARVDELLSAPLHPAVPPEFRRLVAAYAAICHTLTEDAGAEGLEALLGDDGGESVNDGDVTALVRCVLGWHHLGKGRDHLADPLIADGARVILDGHDPSFKSFALWLLARLAHREAGERARDASCRYQRILMHERTIARTALARSVRARLQTGRLRAERDRFARESLTDSLTGLANRRALETRLQEVTPSSTLIMVDIDQFKPINDEFGHDIGDQVLRRIGGILLECIRPGDLAARLGGDEFVVVLDAADRQVALRRGDEVAERIATEPWSDLHLGLQVHASVGVAWGATGGVALYREADEGLYRAKRAGGGTVRGGLPTDAGPATETTDATPT